VGKLCALKRMRGIAAAVLILGGTALPGLAQQRISPQEFLVSPGAQAFKAQDFAAAVDGFRALLASYPDDPLVLRYTGIALDRLGQYDEAVAAFGQALQAAPGDVPILFFLGVTEYNRADFKAAEGAFAEIAAKAPDTDYGARSREFLAAIKSNATQQVAPAATKHWDAYVQLGLQYDDNVAGAPDGTSNRDSIRSTEFLRLGYNLINDSEWLLRAEASGYFSQHWQHAFDSQDVQFGEAALDLDHATTLGGVSIVPSLRYGLTGTLLDSDEFLIGHRLSASADIGWDNTLKTNVHYRLAIDDYDDDGFLPVATSRDGETHEAGITQYILFNTFGRESRFSLGYLYQHRDADGLNHESRTHTVSAGLALTLPEDFTLQLYGYVGWDKYPNFEGVSDPVAGTIGGQRETDIYGANVALSRPITDNLSASLSYAYRKENSNYSTLDYDRNIVSFTLGYSF
jgi:tetratricopeptide (TPR) repeat protein